MDLSINKGNIMSNKIEHVIVLMLENRSFDHMFGFLDHGNKNFPRIDNSVKNPYRFPPYEIPATCDATKTILKGPNHRHDGVMMQIYNALPNENGYNDLIANNAGFVNEYEDYVNLKLDQRGAGPEIMKCFKPDQIPVLSTLAKEFAVFTNWYSSVPGMTWPNRAFLHTGTSEGEVDIVLRPYKEKTIFELLQENDVSWRSYVDGPSHLWAYPALAKLKHRYKIHRMSKFYKHLKKGKLGAYNFIEPDHFGKNSTSQHPMNSEVEDKDDLKAGIKAFVAAEELITDIYNSLKACPEVFNKTLFLITYDEHGGFFDRKPPPAAIRPDKKSNSDYGHNFLFDRLGVRVPTVAISPLIEKGSIDNTIYDHTAVIRSLCTRFLPSGRYLKERDKQSANFWGVINRATPRTELPSVRPENYEDVDIEKYITSKNYPLDVMQEALVDLSFEMHEALKFEIQTSEQINSSSSKKDASDYLNAQWWGQAASTHREKFSSDRGEMIKFSHYVADRFQQAGED